MIIYVLKRRVNPFQQLHIYNLLCAQLVVKLEFRLNQIKHITMNNVLQSKLIQRSMSLNDTHTRNVIIFIFPRPNANFFSILHSRQKFSLQYFHICFHDPICRDHHHLQWTIISCIAQTNNKPWIINGMVFPSFWWK